MRTDVLNVLRCVSLTIPLLVIGNGALAERPDWAGRPGDHGWQRDRDDDRGDDRGERGERGDRDVHRHMDPGQGVYFNDTRRSVIREHYAERERRGRCPPGLAKKHNGCMPPGQDRAWTVGQPLPREVPHYPVEPSVQVKLGKPPAGYEFVRVASDILLIAVGTSIVMDAVENLGR
jgi:Ni/Co efflux regulator RcnB